MYKITKQFTDYPFAHRQPNHKGHCRMIHGHNWDFEIVLESTELDKNGFVYDFGNFKEFREWLDEMFDHTVLINEDDPQIDTFHVLNAQCLMEMRIVKSCSCEGIAKLVYGELERRFEKFKDTIRISYVRVYEDATNSALYMGG